MWICGKVKLEKPLPEAVNKKLNIGAFFVDAIASQNHRSLSSSHCREIKIEYRARTATDKKAVAAAIKMNVWSIVNIFIEIESMR